MSQPWRRLSNLFIALFILGIGGCAGEKQGLIWDTFKLGLFGNQSLIDQASLNPSYRYLRVEINDRLALLVLGYENRTADNTNIQVWYSGNKEVVQLDGGRLIGTGGLDSNWTDVVLDGAPSITDPQLFPRDAPNRAATARNPKFYFFRTRTVMPQFIVNIHESVVMQGLDEVPADIPHLLRDPEHLAKLKWVQETVVLAPNNPSVHPLRAIYAYDKNTRQIIYGRQCLNQQECLSWLTWPYPQKAVSSTGQLTPSRIKPLSENLISEGALK